MHRSFSCVALLVLLASPAPAQTPPPVTLHATRLEQPLNIDGRLDDAVYARVPSTTNFIQQVPREHDPATEQTKIWVFFDDNNLYVSAYCLDSNPDRIRADELRRDGIGIFTRNDSLAVVLDTLHDRRNGYQFQTNAIGGMRDQQIKDGDQDDAYNMVWDVNFRIVADGWTMEMVIPFKSLRYRGSGVQDWGMNVRRVVKWKNETSFLAPIPASYGGVGVGQMQLAATVTGIETPARSLNLELKPYAVSTVTTDRAAAVPFTNDVEPNAGIDVNYGITKSLTADLTLNTDFAQVEEDVQQVNLTRFNLMFPEKRDFFLEGQGIFQFGGPCPFINPNAPTVGSNLPILFFSRRIGLSNGQPTPVVAGARLTGKTGPYDIGVVAIRTGDKPSASAVATNFGAVRLRRDILRRSGIGLMATGRWPAAGGTTENAAVGADVDLRCFTNVQVAGYFAKTQTPGLHGLDTSHRARFSYAADRYGLEMEELRVAPHFNPEMGFLRRTDFSSRSVTARFSPRPRRNRLIRRLNWHGTFEHVGDARRRRLKDRTLNGAFTMELHTSDFVNLSVTRHSERLPADFAIASGIVVPQGHYDSDTFNVSYSAAQQRRLAGTVSASRGSFYGGTKTTTGYSGGSLRVSPHVGFEPTLTWNWVDLPYGNCSARLAGMRMVVAPTARLGFGSLVQFNPSARTLSASARMRWEYTSGSEVFVVYSDGRDTSAPGLGGLVNRSFAVKVTRLVRF